MSGNIVPILDGKTGKIVRLQISAAPAIRAKLRRVFGFGHGKPGNHDFELTLSPEVAADVLWVLKRFTLNIPPEALAALRAIEARSAQIRCFAANLEQCGPDMPLAQPDKITVPLRPYQTQAVTLATATGGLLIADDLGLGKEQPSSEPIPTPSGWRTMGDLKPGDLVFGRDGQPIAVQAIYPQGIKRVFKVTFSDGAWTRCGLEHLWHVKTDSGKPASVLPLSEIIRRGIFYCNGNPKNTIPRQGAAAFESPRCPFDPYFIGVILGDGYVEGKNLQVTIGNRDVDIIGRLPAPLSNRPAPGCRQLTYGHELTKAIRAYGIHGLSKEKAIPLHMQILPQDQRLALLRGLMDTDGSCSHNRNVFHSCSPLLAAAVKTLVDSLGGFASVRHYPRVDKSDDYQVRIQMDDCPFLTAHKAAQWRPPKKGKRGRRRIVNVEEQEPEESLCISVPGSLYLTRDFLVTHNTAQGIGILAAAGGGLVVCDTHLQQQWRDQVHKFWPTAISHIVRTTLAYITKADVIIVPYSKLHGWQDALRPKAIVFDECQALRHAQTRRYEAAAVLREKAKTCAGLSATPIYNYANEIWNVLNVIQPAALGSEWEFRREWCGDSVNGSVADPIALGQYLRAQSLMIRRTRKDVGRELPKVQQITCPVEFDVREFDKLKKEANMLAHTILHGQFTERGIASRRLTSALRQATGIAKARQVAELISSLAKNEKILVAAWHREVYGILEKVLRESGHEVCYYTGTESNAGKLRSLATFRDNAGIMLLSLRSGAGLDGLQEFVSTAVFAELDYSPAVMRQVIGRLNRDGQDKPVTVFLPLIDQGSDPVIANILGLKDEQSLGLIGDTESDKTLGDTDTETESRATLLARAWLAQKHNAP